MKQFSHCSFSVTSLGCEAFNIDLYHESLALRKRTFVDEMRWPLATLNGLETDQYDTLFSHHITATDNGQVVATLRLLPSTHNLFGSTYMILDAHRGRLPGMPSGILEEEIVDPATWEASRLAICKTVLPKNRNALLRDIVTYAMNFIRERDGTRMLGLMNPVFIRILSRLDFNVSQFGPVCHQSDGPICVIKYDF